MLKPSARMRSTWRHLREGVLNADVAEGGCVTGPGVAKNLLQSNILLPACASASVFAF